MAFLGWFGPRGLATIVFGLLAVEELGADNAVMNDIAGTIVFTVLFSVFAHGMSAAPLAARYGAWAKHSNRPSSERPRWSPCRRAAATGTGKSRSARQVGGPPASGLAAWLAGRVSQPTAPLCRYRRRAAGQYVDMENLDIVRNPDAHCFEMLLDGERIGVIDYTQDDCVVTMTHTEISDDHSGKGFAARLVQAALADVRDSGEQVVPDCAYVRKYIGKHPSGATWWRRDRTPSGASGSAASPPSARRGSP